MGKTNHTHLFARLHFLCGPMPSEAESSGNAASSQCSAAFPPNLRRVSQCHSTAATNGNSASPNSASPTAPSIRCPARVLQDAEVTALVEQGGTVKVRTGRRGPVTMKCLQGQLKMGKFSLDFDGKKVVGDLEQKKVVRCIGAIIRTYIAMNKPTFSALPEDEKILLFYQLNVCG
jgi:hypothetical protein